MSRTNNVPARISAIHRASTVAVSALITLFATHGVSAQSAAAPAKHPPVCAKGVQVYESIDKVPVPHDTLTMPPAPGPVIVTSEAEAEAADLAMRGRAGSVGATGVVVLDDIQDSGGERIVRRRGVIPVFVPSDSARAQRACAK